MKLALADTSNHRRDVGEHPDDDRPAPTYKKGTKGIRVKYKASVKTKTPLPKDLDAYSMFYSAPSEKGLSIKMYGSKKVPKYKK